VCSICAEVITVIGASLVAFVVLMRVPVTVMFSPAAGVVSAPVGGPTGTVCAVADASINDCVNAMMAAELASLTRNVNRISPGSKK
jgi:hypothetical protein